MKVSVVIPVYNEEKYLKDCLESLSHQEVPADEIIVVDNNSSDKSMEIAKQYKVKILHETKQGITPTRNTGFNAAQYDIIARCDADTHLDINWIKRIKWNFEHYTIDAVTGPANSYDFPLISFLPFTKFYHHICRLLAGYYTLVGFNMAMTQTIWDKVKNDICLDDKLVHDDVDLSIHITKAGGVIRYDPHLLVSTSSRRVTKNIWSFFVEYPLRLRRTLKIHNTM